MEALEDIKKKMEYLEHIKKLRNAANLKYYHKRIKTDEQYRLHLRKKALERYNKKKEQQQNQQ